MAEFGRTNAEQIIQGIGTLFGIFGGKIDRAVKRSLEWLRDGIVGLGKTLAEFAAQTGLMLARVVGLLRRFWARVLLPLLRRLEGWADRIQKWLRSTFGPIIEALLWLRRKIFEIYDRWLRPIFDTIDVIRRVLSVLSFLHLDVARKLDAKLAALEERLRRPLELVIRKVNEAIDIVDRVITLDGLFQRLALLRSIERDIGRIGAIWHAAQSRPLTDEERRTDASAPGLKPPEQSVSDLRAYLRTGDGPNSRWAGEWTAELRRRLANV